MKWLPRFQVRHFFRHSIWILPSFSLPAALVTVRVTYEIDLLLALESNLDPEAVRAILGILAGALFTVVVFVCSALLIAMQLASAQLTPRIIALVFRDPATVPSPGTGPFAAARAAASRPVCQTVLSGTRRPCAG
jgi:uncharacterized membrane protein